MRRPVPRPVYWILAFDLLVFASAAALLGLLPDPGARLISDLYPIVLSVLCTGLAVQIYRSLTKGQRARRLWALLAAGFAGWALGEILWGIYDLVLRIAAPYPSLADLFYLSGDLFLVVFFAMQVRFLRIVLRGWKRYLAIGLVLLFLLVAIVVVCLPMLANPSRNWLEFGLNLLYETMYVLLLAGATTLAFALYEGWLGRHWAILVSGIWFNIFANQIFFYASWHSLYYPGGQATPVSRLFDLLYIGSYLVILAGLYLRQALPFPTLRIEEALASLSQRRPWETWVLLSDESGRACFVDPRLPSLLGIEDVGALTGEFIGQILGLRTGLEDQMLREARAQGFSQPQRVLLGGGIYALQAIAEKGPPSGMYWLLTPWESRPDIRPGEQVSPEALLAQAMRGAGSAHSSGSLARRYVHAVTSLASLLCARFGGEEVVQQFGQQFIPALQACEETWESGNPPGAECREHLQKALEYVLLVVPAAEVRQALDRLEAELGEESVQAAERLGLRLRVP